MISYGVLGPLRLVLPEGEELRLGHTKRRLVMRLLAEDGRPLSASDIAGDVWPVARESGRHLVQSHVHQLRSVLGPDPIQTRGGSYRLVFSADELDSHLFERRVEAAGRARTDGQPALATYLLRSALGLWRGPAWADVAETNWAQSQAARLDQLRLEVEELLLEARLAAGERPGPGPVWPHPAGVERESTRGQSEGAAGQWRGGRQLVLSAAGRSVPGLLG